MHLPLIKVVHFLYQARMVSEPRWTRWSWRGSAASPSSQPPHTRCGRTITSTLSTLRVTSTSPLRYYYLLWLLLPDFEPFISSISVWLEQLGSYIKSVLAKSDRSEETFLLNKRTGFCHGGGLVVSIMDFCYENASLTLVRRKVFQFYERQK